MRLSMIISVVLGALLLCAGTALAAYEECPDGMTPAEEGYCQAIPQCTDAKFLYDPALKLCTFDPPPIGINPSGAPCPEDYTLSGRLCYPAPEYGDFTCPEGSAWDSGRNLCRYERALIVDADNDGVTGADGDCDDTEPLAYPGNTEIAGDGIDNDCDGQVDLTVFEMYGYEVPQDEQCLTELLPGGYWGGATACPEGYSYDAEVGECLGTFELCPPGTSLNERTDRCEAPFWYECESGYTLNGSVCEATPTCTSPGVYSADDDKCLAPLIGYDCPDSMTYDGVQCVADPVCKSPGTYSNAQDKCLHTFTGVTCPPGTGWDGNDCISSPNCRYPGSYSNSQNRCLTNYTGIICPSGTSWNGSSCESAPRCQNDGHYSYSQNVCFRYFDAVDCPGASVWNGTMWGGTGCETPPQCSGSGTYSTSQNKCLADAITVGSTSCPSGYTYNSTYKICVRSACSEVGGTAQQKYSTYGGLVCSTSTSGSVITIETAPLSRSLSSCTVVITADYIGRESCTGNPGGSCYGSFWFGDISFDLSCRADNPAFAGSVSPDWPQTWSGHTITVTANYTTICPAGYTVYGSGSTSTCKKSAVTDWNLADNCTLRSDEVYESTTGSCYYYNQQTSCPSGYSWDSSLSKCTRSASCSVGSLNTSSDQCLNQNQDFVCPSGYSWSSAYFRCVDNATCIAGSLNGSVDKCLASESYSCPSGYGWSSSLSKCTRSSTCTAGSLSTSRDLCEASHDGYVCPIGYSWSDALFRCTRPSTCTDGRLDTATNACEEVAVEVCDPGFSWSNLLDTCQSTPLCQGTSVLNRYRDLCREMADKICPDPLALNTIKTVCTGSVNCQDEGAFDGDLENCSLGRPADAENPQLFFAHECDLFRDGVVTELEYLALMFEDNLDLAPTLESLRITGGPNGIDQPVEWIRSTGYFALQFPPMMPSNGVPYLLTATGTDWEDNRIVVSATIDYQPRLTGLNSNDTLLLPAIPHNFSRKDGHQALYTKPLATPKMHLIDGSGAVWAIVPKTAESGISINDLTVQPGQTVQLTDGYDFDSVEGRLDLAARALSGDATSSMIYLVTDRPYAPVVEIPVEIWNAETVTIEADSWEIMQMVDLARITAESSSATRCRLTGTPDGAQSRDLFTQPGCYVKWSNLVPDLELNYPSPPSWGGRVPALGDHQLDYQIQVFDADGVGHVMTSGSKTLTVKAIETFTLTPNRDIETVYAKAQELDFMMEQTEGPRCPLNTDVDMAKAVGAKGDLMCLVTWDVLPDAIAAKNGAYSAYPALSGAIVTEGTFPMQWSISAFDKSGNEVPLISDSMEIEAIRPPEPEINLLARMNATDDGTFLPSVYGGTLGYLKVGAPASVANLTVEIEGGRNGFESAQYRNWFSTDSTNTKEYSRLLRIPAGGTLWDQDEVAITAYYTDYPEVRSSAAYPTLRVPPESTRMALELTGDALDTTGIPLRSRVGGRDGLEMVYDQAIHGLWNAQFGETDRDDNYTPLMDDFGIMTGGLFDTTIGDVEIGRITVIAKGQIASPDGAYQREILSNKRYITVFKGDTPDGEIYVYRYSGPVPYSTILSLDLDAASLAVLGQVNWEISYDQGDSWEALENDPIRWRKKVLFEEPGVYQLRAEVFNKLSGAHGYTETAEITTYYVPEIEVTGTEAAFTQAPVTLNANPTINGEPAAADDVIIEWLNRDGEVVNTGPQFQTSYEAPGGYLYDVRARTPVAPAEDKYSWGTDRYYVKVYEPRPPSGIVRVPRYMETLKEYPLTASTVYLPYPGMDPQDYPIRGAWTLPDGTVVEELDTLYTPPDALALEGNYTNIGLRIWIEGYADRGAESITNRRVRIGQYIWPDFEIRTHSYVNQAPARFTLYALPIDFAGTLEDPQYTWHLPDGIEVIDVYKSKAIVNFTKAGIYDVSVDIVDRRDSRFTATGQIVIEQAEPFVLTPSLYYSNDFKREPLTVQIRPRVEGGHPLDQMNTFAYTVNGEPIGKRIGSLGIAEDLPAGDHQIVMTGTSNYGVTSEKILPVTVTVNQPPVCTIRKDFVNRSFMPYYRLNASCEDSDGRVQRYRWTHNDDVVGSVYQVAIAAPEEGEGVKQITLTATDDGDKEAVYQVELTYQAPEP